MGGTNKEKEASNSQNNKKHSLKVRKVAGKRKKTQNGTVKLENKEQSSKKKKEKKQAYQYRKPMKSYENIEHDIAGISRGRVVKERDEKQKKIIMYFGVAFFMVLISIFWLYSSTMEIKKRGLSTSFSGADSNWSEMSEELGRQMIEMKEGLDQIRDFASTSQAQLELEQENLDNDLIYDLKKNLETKASTTASSTFYFKLSEEERVELLESLDQIELGDDIGTVFEQLGEPDLVEDIKDSKGVFVAKIVRYYLSLESAEEIKDKDEYIRIEFDENNQVKEFNIYLNQQ